MLFFFFLVMLVLIGILTCIAVATDPNTEPNPQRQRLLPVGLAMLFAGVGELGSIIGLDYMGDTLDSHLPYLLRGVVVLGVCGLGGIGGGAIGFIIGKRRNMKLNY